jgi:hypothetical protein
MTPPGLGNELGNEIEVLLIFAPPQRSLSRCGRKLMERPKFDSLTP